MWNSLSDLEKFGLLFIFMGSVVDVFQFIWILRSRFNLWKESLVEKAIKDDLYRDWKKTHDFPGIRGDEMAQAKESKGTTTK